MRSTRGTDAVPNVEGPDRLRAAALDDEGRAGLRRGVQNGGRDGPVAVAAACTARLLHAGHDRRHERHAYRRRVHGAPARYIAADGAQRAHDLSEDRRRPARRSTRGGAGGRADRGGGRSARRARASGRRACRVSAAANSSAPTTSESRRRRRSARPVRTGRGRPRHGRARGCPERCRRRWGRSRRPWARAAPPARGGRGARASAPPGDLVMDVGAGCGQGGAMRAPGRARRAPSHSRHHQRGGDQHAEGQQERGLSVHGRPTPYRERVRPHSLRSWRAGSRDRPRRVAPVSCLRRRAAGRMRTVGQPILPGRGRRCSVPWTPSDAEALIEAFRDPGIRQRHMRGARIGG